MKAWLKMSPSEPATSLVSATIGPSTTPVSLTTLGTGLPPGSHGVLGFVTDEDLLHLYNACEIFVFPSFYEGFGLPILEGKVRE